MELKDVDERDDMGAKLYVTPQAALMIATYDAEGHADVMMAAWVASRRATRRASSPAATRAPKTSASTRFFSPPRLCRCPHGGGERLRRHGRRPRGERQGGPEYENAGMRECVNSLIR